LAFPHFEIELKWLFCGGKPGLPHFLTQRWKPSSDHQQRLLATVTVCLKWAGQRMLSLLDLSVFS